MHIPNFMPLFVWLAIISVLVVLIAVYLIVDRWDRNKGEKPNRIERDEPNSKADFDRLAGMLIRIEKSLGDLTTRHPGIVDPELRSAFLKTWAQASRNLKQVIVRLQNESPSNDRSTLHRELERAGLTGAMLQMKEMSLYFYLDPIDKFFVEYSKTIDRIVSQPLTGKESLAEKAFDWLLKWVKPGFKVINSILGSLPKAAFPGIEVVKELKEHVEASYEVADALEKGPDPPELPGVTTN